MNEHRYLHRNLNPRDEIVLKLEDIAAMVYTLSGIRALLRRLACRTNSTENVSPADICQSRLSMGAQIHPPGTTMTKNQKIFIWQ
jgi:hypothetical protein